MSENVALEAESVSDAPVADSVELPAAGEPSSSQDFSDWRSALPPELRENPTIQDTKSVEALAKRLVDTKSMLGQSIRIPSEDASPEDIQAFRQSLVEKKLGLMPIPDNEDTESLTGVYRALGMPEDASGYVGPEQWAGVDESRYNFLAEQAHKAGLTKKQFQDLTNNIAQADNQMIESVRQERDAELSQLKNEWGRAFDQKYQRAGVIAKQLEAPEGLINALNHGDVDAGTLRWLDKIAERFSGEGNNLVRSEYSVSEHTPSELRERITELTDRLIKMDSRDPMFTELNKKRIKYAEMLHSEG